MIGVWNRICGATGQSALGLILLAGFAVLAPAAPRLAARAPAKQVLPADAGGYHLLNTFKIGGEGFWDYMGMDARHRHLFVSHGTHVVVLNADTGKPAGDIPDTDGVHGIAVASELKRGFISDGRSSMVTVFDLATLRTIGTVKVTGEDPDCIVYDPASERVFTFNGRTSNSTAIDAKTLKVVGTIDLGGRPEYAVADGRGHIYNNLEDKSEQVAIDAHTLKITARWPLAPCESPSGLAMDTAHRRLFAGCHNELMAIVDPDAGKVVATVPIGRGVDANRFDPGTQLAFSSNGDGTLTVVHEDSPDHFTVLGNVKTEMGARTMEVDPRTHHVFLVTASFGPRPTAAPQGGFRRPPMVPGSFRVLEYGQ